MGMLTWKNGQYLLDGQPYRIISGAIHYFRVVPEYWEDRLLKLKACGFNTVETYIAWNVHEPKEREFHFSGMADIVSFIEIAGKLGLHVIVRPSPFICAEWEFGGLPGWLLGYGEIRLRCSDPLYLSKVDHYYDELIPRLVPLLSTHGGPILAVQVENEYGSYGNDHAYLEYLRAGLVRRGVDVLLFTSDGPTDEMLLGGTLGDVHATVNFGSRVEESFRKYREYRTEEPLMVMEFWNGWFDHWMEDHHVRDAADVAGVLDEMLEKGSSINMYMFHGGTNFGFYSGANHIQAYEPTTTSYDYDAPLTEWGDQTEKYKAVRTVLSKHGFKPGCPLPEPIPKAAYGKVALSEMAGLFADANLEHLSIPIKSVCTQTMEKFGQSYGFILYSTFIQGPRQGQQLHIQEVGDRAQLFLDGRPLGVIERWKSEPLDITVPAGGARLDILVENMGRINYGPLIRDSKGITEGVRIDNQFLYNWTIRTLPLEPEMLSSLSYTPVTDEGRAEQEEMAMPESENAGLPRFYRGSFRVEDIGDTFLRFDGWTKGAAWINGFNLGRYWNAGPQKALYIPGPLLRKGENELVLFELHGGPESCEVELSDQPDLGQTAAVDEAVLNFVQDGEDK
ncbi:glycoside hydrolase family 35 protein [Paenibacillus sp. MDMC362]|uniref:glycoside hydrolase family 35 protein n=1 Tax=Paenibacillus sp. MDMC362 TaxID=2977365 RepID=UPI000DC2F230|nr:glycoside hydrolase family 35 protein [Paenibacillus sp. MDMC362]RAR44195.1 beta-galactosidase [Paenibacillus sp. MDMC362]